MENGLKQSLTTTEINHHFFPCECGGEGLLCTRFSSENEKEIYLAIYKYGQFQNKPNIWKRLKYCWYHLKTGKKYEDQIIFNFDKAKEVGKWLIKNSN